MSSTSLYDLRVNEHAKHLLEERFCKNCKYFVLNSDGVPWYNHCLENLDRMECTLRKELCEICSNLPECILFHLCRKFKHGLEELSIDYICDEYECGKEG